MFRRAPVRPPALVSLLSLGILAAACSQSSAAPTTGSAALAPSAIAVTASEFAFDPSQVTTSAGETTFLVTNAGTLEHEFEIFKGDQVVDEVEGIVPGLTRDLTVDLAPGQYTYVCKLTGHEDAGMKGTLTVTG